MSLCRSSGYSFLKFVYSKNDNETLSVRTDENSFREIILSC